MNQLTTTTRTTGSESSDRITGTAGKKDYFHPADLIGHVAATQRGRRKNSVNVAVKCAIGSSVHLLVNKVARQRNDEAWRKEKRQYQ